MKEYAKKFYSSKEWKDCRNAYYNINHGVCERCGGIGKVVHHKIYITPRNIHKLEIVLCFDNLELLCQDCHNKEHISKIKVTRSDVKFDEYGNLIPVSPPP